MIENRRAGLFKFTSFANFDNLGGFLKCTLIMFRSYLTSLSDPQGQPRPQKFKFSTVSLCFPEWMTDVEELRTGRGPSSPVRPGSDSEEAEADTWLRLETIMRRWWSHAGAGLANIGRPRVTQHGAPLPVRAGLTHNVIMAGILQWSEQSLALTAVITALVFTLESDLTTICRLASSRKGTTNLKSIRYVKSRCILCWFYFKMTCDLLVRKLQHHPDSKNVF